MRTIFFRPSPPLHIASRLLLGNLFDSITGKVAANESFYKLANRYYSELLIVTDNPF